ncbi:MAG: malate/lactate/ureidoglycolate dehydrogenase [Gammaproteobacteria bacterium]|nr:malate/lactate/ureidoglycolate dehydrogenase [Gammaproteobacteria bacterium]|tara:strand:- start:669 stop:1739 length:1071 start_codon:yes stop_codon:yes gene_type:complete
MLIHHQPLTRFIGELFVRFDAAPEDAALVASHLVAANLKGHDSHGVGMVPAYVGNIRRGKLNVAAQAKVVHDKGAVLLADGQMGFGQVVGRQAVDFALERVASTGIVCTGVRNCHHLGRIGSYGERCGEAGYVSIHFVNVVGHDPLVSPFGGREPRISTNPFCCVVPQEDGPPIVLDMATSAIAQGKVRVAYNQGVPVGEGALIDHEGAPTTDPAVMFEEPKGALGPFGKHKGYGLGLMCELLGGGLAGEWTAAQASHEEQGFSIINHMLMLVLDPDLFGGADGFRREVADMVDYLQSTNPAVGTERVMVPGEPEIAAMETRRAEGIPIDDNTWAAILKSAEVAGMTDSEVDDLIS